MPSIFRRTFDRHGADGRRTGSAGPMRLPARGHREDRAYVREPDAKHPFVTVQWTIECGLLEVNPAGRMPKRAKESAKDRVLAPDEIRSRWPALDGESSVTARLRFLLLSGLRPSEVAGLEVGEVVEVDAPARARVPVARHTLSQALRRVIKDLPEATIIRRPYPTPHDFRRFVATGLAALGVPREDRLAVLAHAQGDVLGKYCDKYDRLAAAAADGYPYDRVVLPSTPDRRHRRAPKALWPF